MIFGAKIQIFQKLTIEINKCHFWRENSNETILMIFIHCGHHVLTKVLLDIKTFEVLSDKLVIVRPPNESWYKMSEPEKK